MRTPHPFHLLPLYARCAIEYLGGQAERSIAKLDSYIEHYAKAAGQLVDEQTRFSAHAKACLRYPNLDKTGSLAVWTGSEAPSLANCTYQPTQTNLITTGVSQ